MKNNLQVIGESDRLMTQILDEYTELLEDFIDDKINKKSMSAAQTYISLALASHYGVIFELEDPSIYPKKTNRLRPVRKKKHSDAFEIPIKFPKGRYSGKDFSMRKPRRRLRRFISALIWGLVALVWPQRGLEELKKGNDNTIRHNL